MQPAMALAAASAGLIRCVRPPRPCRFSKLRFDVAPQRSPGCSRSGFMPTHIEHPGSRSEEHTSELQSLMRISYAVFCLKKKKHKHICTNTDEIISSTQHV